MENYSYYFWKWGDDKVPGPPREIIAALLRGKLHPAVQPFDASPLLQDLEELAARNRTTEKEWIWDVVPKNSPAKALFVYVTGSYLGEPDEGMQQFRDASFRLGLGGIEDRGARLIEWLPPKINRFYCDQFPELFVYDFPEADLAGLLGRVDLSVPIHCGIQRRDPCFVQSSGQKFGFSVEWFENSEHWRAGDPARLYRRESSETNQATLGRVPDMLRWADVLVIFRAVLARQPRPVRYDWKDITKMRKTV